MEHTATRMAAPGNSTALYRSLLREARKFSNYNVREYIKRRSRQGFEDGRNVAGQEQVEAFKFGVEQLEIAKRQAVLSHLYVPRVKSIMEVGE